MYGNETSSVALVSWKRAAVSAEPSWSVIVSLVYSVIAQRLLFSQSARNFDTKSAFWNWRIGVLCGKKKKPRFSRPLHSH